MTMDDEHKMDAEHWGLLDNFVRKAERTGDFSAYTKLPTKPTIVGQAHYYGYFTLSGRGAPKSTMTKHEGGYFFEYNGQCYA